MPTRAKATDLTDPSTPTVTEDAIRQRAYYLWEADGRPDGRGEQYWHRALEEAQRAATKPVKTSTRKAAAPKAEKPAKVKAEAAPKPAKAPRKSAKTAAEAK